MNVRQRSRSEQRRLPRLHGARPGIPRWSPRILWGILLASAWLPLAAEDEPCRTKAECQRQVEALEQQLLVNEEEMKALRERASQIDELERSIDTGEKAILTEKRARLEKDHTLLARVREEREWRRMREADLDRLRGNLLFPGLGNLRQKEVRRAAVWGSLFLASALACAKAASDQQRLASRLGSLTWNPIAYPAAEREHNAAFHQATTYGLLAVAFYAGSVADAVLASRQEPRLQMDASFRF